MPVPAPTPVPMPAGHPPPDAAEPQGRVRTPQGKANYATVRTYYATDRLSNGKADPLTGYGGGRSETLHYGFCEVSIPRDHQMGMLESPSILRLEFKETPTKHVVVLRTAERPRDAYFAELAAQVRQSPRRSAFLFVHGYNVSFANAARRTAQMAYDLGFEGAPVFYSWPSQGKTEAYTVDEQNVEWAQPNLRAFLEDFFQRSEAENIYLIAHSMGNRALSRALVSFLESNPRARSRLKEIILTAPDIDAEVFKRDIVPALTSARSRVTLYASSKDLALLASKKVHGYPRAGDAGAQLVLAPGLETVDASEVDTSLLGHSYFAETRTLLGDIYTLIKEDKPAGQRYGLKAVESPRGKYWAFKK